MKNKIALSIVSLILAFVMLFSLYSCTAAKAETVDLMENITAKEVEGKSVDDTFKKAHADFSAELFKRSFDGENTLISPLSVMLALGMTATGAEGNTAAQFTELFGGIEAAELSEYLKSYVKRLSPTKLDIANSVWFKEFDSFPVKESFLQGVADYYSADVFKGISLDAVNQWVKDNTDGMIERMLESLDPATVMLLANTVLFDAEWEEQYNEHQIHDGEFTTKDGTKKKVQMMSSSENSYIESDLATGVMKPYADGEFAFTALLPNEGVTVEELIESLDGEMLRETLSSAERKDVITRIPQFEYDFSIVMNSILSEMGLLDAFTPGVADFSGISDNARELLLYIGRVLHKTRIEVTPTGTKAAAATIVDMKYGSAMPVEPPKEVILDRPFVYMIVDTETDLPIFIGAVTDIGE